MYGAEIVRRLATLDTALRTSIITNDALNLTSGVLLTQVNIPPAGPKDWSGHNAAAKQRAFNNWLGNALAQMLEEETSTGLVPQWLKTFVRAAYTKGLTSAMGMIQKQRPEIRQAVNQILNTPFHRERLEGLFDRNFTELKGFSQTMATKLQRALADGLLAGDNPKAIARRISDEIGISKARARTIARTETIRTNAEAQLNTFDRFGVRQVEVEAEWVTAGFKVCPICVAKSKKSPYTIEQARGLIPQHPNCRCGWVPVVVTQSAMETA